MTTEADSPPSWIAEVVRRNGLVNFATPIESAYAARATPYFEASLEYEPRSLAIDRTGTRVAVGTKSGEISIIQRGESGVWQADVTRYAVQGRRAVRVVAFVDGYVIYSAGDQLSVVPSGSLPPTSSSASVQSQQTWLSSCLIPDVRSQTREGSFDQWFLKGADWLPLASTAGAGLQGLLLTRSDFGQIVWRRPDGGIRVRWVSLHKLFGSDIKLPILASWSTQHHGPHLIDASGSLFRLEWSEPENPRASGGLRTRRLRDFGAEVGHISKGSITSAIPTSQGVLLRIRDLFGYAPSDGRQIEWHRIPNVVDFAVVEPPTTIGGPSRWLWTICATLGTGIQLARWERESSHADTSLGVLRHHQGLGSEGVVRIASGRWRNTDGDQDFLVLACRDHHLRIASYLDIESLIPDLKSRFTFWWQHQRDFASIRREPALARVQVKADLDRTFRNRGGGDGLGVSLVKESLIRPTESVRNESLLGLLDVDDLRDLVRYFTQACLADAGKTGVGPNALTPSGVDAIQSWVLRFLEIAQRLRRAEPDIVIQVAETLVEGLWRVNGVLPRRSNELQALGQILRKWVILGHTYENKPFGLERLIEWNEQGGRHLDAVIYSVALLRRRVDGESCVSFPAGEYSPAIRAMATAPPRAVDGINGSCPVRLMFQAHRDGRITAADERGRICRWHLKLNHLSLHVHRGGLIRSNIDRLVARYQHGAYARALFHDVLPDGRNLLVFCARGANPEDRVGPGAEAVHALLTALVIEHSEEGVEPVLSVCSSSRSWLVDFEVHCWARTISRRRCIDDGLVWEGVLLAGLRSASQSHIRPPFREIVLRVPLNDTEKPVHWLNAIRSVDGESEVYSVEASELARPFRPPEPTHADAMTGVNVHTLAPVCVRPYLGDGCTLIWVGRDDGRIEVYEGLQRRDKDKYGLTLRSDWRLMDRHSSDHIVLKPDPGSDAVRQPDERLYCGDPISIVEDHTLRDTGVQWSKVVHRGSGAPDIRSRAAKERDVEFEGLEIVDDILPDLEEQRYVAAHARDRQSRPGLDAVRGEVPKPHYRHERVTGRVRISGSRSSPERVSLRNAWHDGWIRSDQVELHPLSDEESSNEAERAARTCFVDTRPLFVGSPVTALAVTGEQVVRSRCDDCLDGVTRPTMLAYGTTDGLIVLRWLMRRGSEREVPAVDLVQTIERDAIAALEFVVCDGVPVLIAITRGGYVEMIDVNVECATAGSGGGFPIGHRKDRFRLPVMGPTSIVWSTTHRDGRIIPSIAVGTTSGQVFAVHLVAARGSPLRTRLQENEVKWFTPGAGQPSQVCLSNARGLAEAIGERRIARLMAAIDVTGHLQCAATRLLVRRQTKLLLERIEQGAEGVSHFVTHLIEINNDLYQKRPVPTDAIKVIWEETGQVIETLVKRASATRDGGVILQIEVLVEKLDTMCNLWLDSSEHVERALLIHGFHMIYGPRMNALVLKCQPYAARLSQQMLAGVVHRRLTHRDFVVPLECLRWMNLQSFAMLSDILVHLNDDFKGFTLGIDVLGSERAGAGSEGIPSEEQAPTGLLRLMSSVMALGTRSTGRSRGDGPVLFEVARFLGTCLVLIPHHTLLVGVLVTESALNRPDIRLDQAIAEQARAIIWQFETRLGRRVPEICRNAVDRFTDYMSGQVALLASEFEAATQSIRYSDGAIWQHFRRVEDIAEMLERPHSARQEEEDLKRFLRTEPPQMFQHSHLVLRTLAKRRSEVFGTRGNTQPPYWKRMEACLRAEWWLVNRATIFEPQRSRYLRIVSRWRQAIRREREAARVIVDNLDKFNRHVFRATADQMIDTLNELVLQEQPFVLGDAIAEEVELRIPREPTNLDASLSTLDSLSMRYLVQKRTDRLRPLVRQLHTLGVRLAEQAEASSILLLAAQHAMSPTSTPETLAFEGTSIVEVELIWREVCRDEALIPSINNASPSDGKLSGPRELWRAVLGEIARNLSRYGIMHETARGERRKVFAHFSQTGAGITLVIAGTAPFVEQVAEAHRSEVIHIAEALNQGPDHRVRSSDRSLGYGLRMVRALCGLADIGFHVALGDHNQPLSWDEESKRMGFEIPAPNAPLAFIIHSRPGRGPRRLEESEPGA